MAILLTILKVIGIILLVILGLVLLIILLVLFSPISYRITANHNENDTRVKAKVGFLFVNGFGSFIKGEGLDYGVKILFFKVFPRGGKSEEDMDSSEENSQEEDYMSVALPDEEELQSLEGAGAGNVTEPVDSQVADSLAQNSVISTPDGMSTPEGISTSDNISIDEEPDFSSEASDKKDFKSKLQSIFKKKDKAEKDSDWKEEKIPLSDRIDEALDTADEKMDELDKKYVEAMKKLDHVEQFLDKVYVQKTIKRALKIVKRLFGTIKPKKSKGYLHMGLSSAADTGMILGKLAAFYPLYGRWLTIDPDFYYKVIEGDIDIKGRIYLFRIVGPALFMALTPSLWKTIKMAKKI